MLTFGWPDTDEGARVTEALPTRGLVGRGSVSVNGIVGLTRAGLNTVQDTTCHLLLVVMTETERRAAFSLIIISPPSSLFYRVIAVQGLLAVLCQETKVKVECINRLVEMYRLRFCRLQQSRIQTTDQEHD